MILDYNNWRKNVIKWASDKGLIDKKNAYPQYAKVLEETQEILVALNMMERAISKEEYEEGKKLFMDAIGDTFVTLEILSTQMCFDSDECRQFAWNEIKDRTGKTIGGTFVKD